VSTTATPRQAGQTAADKKTPLVQFHRFIPTARLPQRADRSAAGSLPTRAFRYCEPSTSASGYGYYIFPPISFSLQWDGNDIMWTWEGAGTWLPLKSVQFPNFRDLFDAVAPEEVREYSPPFLGALQEPGLVQLWTGLVARTAPGWSLMVRAPVNVPIDFRADFPLLQVQPLPRHAYEDSTLNNYELVPDLKQLTPEDWDDYYDTVVRPHVQEVRPRGQYAAAARKRRAAESGDKSGGT
jgi:hypothetical protein